MGNRAFMAVKLAAHKNNFDKKRRRSLAPVLNKVRHP